MYAVIQTGGKQYRVAEGDRLDVELLDGDDVTLQPGAARRRRAGALHARRAVGRRR